MNNDLKTKLRFTMKNFGIAIRECDDLAHRARVVKYAKLLAEETHPLTRELLWNYFKNI